MSLQAPFLASSLDSNPRHQVHAQPIPDTSRAASSLFRGRTRHIHVIQGSHVPLRIVPFFFDPTGIHDKPDIWYGNRSLGHIRRYDYLTNTGRRDLKNASLIVGR
jgi:hypothetical protein